MFQLILSMTITFIGIFIMELFIFSYIKGNSIYDIGYNKIKLYLALISAIYAVLIDILIYNIHIPTFNKYIYIPIFIILFILIILYRYQGFITDNDYLKDIIENDSFAIFTSNYIKDKTNNKEIIELANKIIEHNKKEIEDINNIIKDSKTINDINKSKSS